MKVLFLDFDGVLTTKSTQFGYGDPSCVRELNRITKMTNSEIVISSTWRFQGLQQCIDNLRTWGVVGDVIDCTPRLIDIEATRGQEIHQYLKDKRNVSRFVILDDDDDMDDLREHLVKCDTMVGLTQEIAELAIQKLL